MGRKWSILYAKVYSWNHCKSKVDHRSPKIPIVKGWWAQVTELHVHNTIEILGYSIVFLHSVFSVNARTLQLVVGACFSPVYTSRKDVCSYACLHFRNEKWTGAEMCPSNCFLDRYWGRAGQQLANFFPALETVPEVVAKANSAQSPSFLKRRILYAMKKPPTFRNTAEILLGHCGLALWRHTWNLPIP